MVSRVQLVTRILSYEIPKAFTSQVMDSTKLSPRYEFSIRKEILLPMDVYEERSNALVLSR
jgi:hypothetical protein